MTDEPERAEELLSQLSLIEDQALEERADAYLQLHDQLAAVLESGEARGR
jgi:hypothetical protein